MGRNTHIKLINYQGAYIAPLKINGLDWDLLPNVGVNALEYKGKELFWGQKTVTGSQGDYDYYFRVGFNMHGEPYVRLAGEEVSVDILEKACDLKEGRAVTHTNKILWNIGGKVKHLNDMTWFYFYENDNPSDPLVIDKLTKNWSLRKILDDVIVMMEAITKLQDEEALENKAVGGVKVITLNALLKSFKKEGN